MERFVEIGKIGMSLLMRVSRRGKGLYLYIPKDVAGVYGIAAGHKVEVKLVKHYRPKTMEEVEEA